MDCVLALLQSDSAPSWENPITTGFGAGEVSAGTISLFLSQPVRKKTAVSRQTPAFIIQLRTCISFACLSVNLYMFIITDSPKSENRSLFCFQRFFLLGNYHTLYNKEETEHCCNGNSCPPRLVKTCRRYNVLNGA